MFARQLLKAVSLRPSAPIARLAVPQTARSSSSKNEDSLQFQGLKRVPTEELSTEHYFPEEISAGIYEEESSRPTARRSKHEVVWEPLVPTEIIPIEDRFREGPERDHVNFPRPIRKENGDPVRFLFIPEEWFELFYKKTGVTGPYVFGASYTLYLLSKEVWVMEHEFPYVLSFYGLVAIAYYKFGNKIYDFIYKNNMKADEILQETFDELLKDTKQRADILKQAKDCLPASSLIQEAKKETIAMLLEAEYRGRALTVYEQVKKRLEYQSQLASIDRRIESKHMVQWIINSVKKSITPQQEKEALKNCFADLKVLASKA